MGFPGGTSAKGPACHCRKLKRDMGQIPGSEDLLEEGMTVHSSILAWRILDRGAWWVTVHGVTKSWTQLSDQHFCFM